MTGLAFADLGYLVKQFSSTNSYFFIKHIYLARKFESVWNMEYVDSCSIHYIKLQILLTYCHNEFLKPLNQDSFKEQKDKNT